MSSVLHDKVVINYDDQVRLSKHIVLCSITL